MGLLWSGTGLLLAASGDDGSSGWTAALVVALVAAVATVVIDRLTQERSAKSAYQGLLRAIRTEVSELSAVAGERAQTPATTFTFHRPLPSVGWQALLYSGHQSRLARDAPLLDALTRLYSSVAEANDLATSAWQSLSLSLQISNDPDASRQFHELALQLLTWPYVNVSEDASAAMVVLP